MNEAISDSRFLKVKGFNMLVSTVFGAIALVSIIMNEVIYLLFLFYEPGKEAEMALNQTLTLTSPSPFSNKRYQIQLEFLKQN